ncbi:MAG: hypothetical protein IPK82_33790 [Polyangiaceae bacterium]|nr:hypothetical protein [Polyangiaceae bacterium]
MFKVISALGALFLYGSLGIAPWGVDARSEQHSSPWTSPPVPKNPDCLISEEERERRVKVCEKEFEDCRDWCTRTNGGRDCYSKCSDKIAECMKQIPYADKD